MHVHEHDPTCIYCKHLEKRSLLRDLEVAEVSAVDKGSNPGARIALTKRDAPDENKIRKIGEAVVDIAKQAFAAKEKSTMSEPITKSAAANGLSAYVTLHKRHDETETQALARLMRAGDPGLAELYELHEGAKLDMPVAKQDAECEMPETDAEEKLRRRAKKRAKKTGTTFAKAYSEILQESDLYKRYEVQKAAAVAKRAA